MEDGQESVYDDFGSAAVTASQRVEPNGCEGVGRVQDDDVILAMFRDAGEDVVDQGAFRLDDDQAASGLDVRQRQVSEQGRFADAGWSKDMQVLELFSDRQVQRLYGTRSSRDGHDALGLTRDRQWRQCHRVARWESGQVVVLPLCGDGPPGERQYFVDTQPERPPPRWCRGRQPIGSFAAEA